MIWGRRGWEENEPWEIDKQTTLASYTRRQTQSYSLDEQNFTGMYILCQ